MNRRELEPTVRKPNTRMTREVGDGPLNSDSYTSERLQAAILALLVNGPMFKWAIRDALRVNERRIYSELQALRKLRKIHVIGRRLDKRQWTLTRATVKADAATAPVRKRRLPRPFAERYADLLT